MPNFEPPRTLEDLHSLDAAEIIGGYMSAERGDPEPGPNRGRAFWFGWRNRMMDMGVIPIDAQHMELTRLVVADMPRNNPKASRHD